MSTSRRTVLVKGGVIGAGFIAGHLSGVEALAAATAPPLRRSLQGLAWNDPIVATYRDAVGIMKQKPANDPFNWVQLAGIHGIYGQGFHYCPHGDWYFLPWHRAFTAMYERVVRHLTRNDAFAMPYWDWTASPRMPDVFLAPKTPDGKPNWLCVTDPGMQRTWPAAKPMPPEIVGASVLRRVLNAATFETFGTSRPAGQNSLDPHWITGGGGVQGTLEATPHNLVHNNIGGWMPTEASPRDPIFFMHHGNIDRIWAVWNLRHANSADPLWTGMPFKDNFRNPDGTFWSPKVSDLFVPETLGYTYGLSAPAAVAAAGARTMSLSTTLETALAAPRPAGAASENLAVAAVDNSRAATPARPLTLAVPVPDAALQAVARRVPVGSGLETMDFSAAQEQAASGTRALAILRDVAITDPRTTAVEVYLGEGPVPAGASDPRYVGTFAVLDHGGAGHGAHGDRALPSFLLDLTDALQRSAGAAGAAAGTVGLRIVPVAAGGGRPGTATPKRVEIVFVTS